MWTEITRPKYERAGRRYASDPADAEWRLIEPYMPAVKHLGRPRETDLPAIVDDLVYRTDRLPVASAAEGLSAVHHGARLFLRLADQGLFERINFELLLQTREAADREPSPSAGVIDSQSVKTTESGGPRGVVHPADIQDRDGPGIVIQAIHNLFPWLRHLFADSVYNGINLREALTKFGDWTIEIVTRAAGATGFQLLPRRWVVERTFAWLNRNHRLAKDFETSITSATTWIYVASTQLLIRRLADA